MPVVLCIFGSKNVLWYIKQFSCDTFSGAFSVFDEASLPTSLLTQHQPCRLQCITSPRVVGSFDSFLRCLEKVFLLLLAQYSLLADQVSPSRSIRTVSRTLEVLYNH